MEYFVFKDRKVTKQQYKYRHHFKGFDERFMFKKMMKYFQGLNSFACSLDPFLHKYSLNAVYLFSIMK